METILEDNCKSHDFLLTSLVEVFFLRTNGELFPTIFSSSLGQKRARQFLSSKDIFHICEKNECMLYNQRFYVRLFKRVFVTNWRLEGFYLVFV